MNYSKKPKRTFDIRRNDKMQQKHHRMLMVTEVKTHSDTYGTGQEEHMINNFVLNCFYENAYRVLILPNYWKPLVLLQKSFESNKYSQVSENQGGWNYSKILT
jgi:hypothetical protein